MSESYGLEEVPGIPQLFILSDRKGFPLLLIAKVVYDFLLAGYPREIKSFHGVISTRFNVGTFYPAAPLEGQSSPYRAGGFNGNYYEYVDAIQPIEISRTRKKEHTESATAEELTNFLSLTGTLNFL